MFLKEDKNIKLKPKYNCSITWEDENGNIIDIVNLEEKHENFSLSNVMDCYGITKYTLFTFPNIIVNQLHYVEKTILTIHHNLFKEYINEDGIIENYNIFLSEFRSMNLILLYNIINSSENGLHQKYHMGMASKNLSKTKTYLLEIEPELINKNQRKYINRIVKNELNDLETDYMEQKGIKTSRNIMNNTIIYFIQQGNDGAIKIGISNNFEKRLAQLQTGSPYRLKVLLTINGNERLEKQLHNKFAEFRLSGEWFKPVGQITDFINQKLKNIA